MSILDVEKVKQEFDRFDTDKSGAIEREEFDNIVRTLLGAREKYDLSERRLEEFWKMLDTDGSGSANLEEFLGFFRKYFWNKCGDTPGSQLNLLDCIGRVPPWSEDRIDEIAFPELRRLFLDEDESMNSDSSDEEGEETYVEPESGKSKLQRAVLLGTLQNKLRRAATD